MHVRVFKRKREGITDYRKRLALVKSGLPRLVVRPSGKGIQAQIVKFSPRGDIVVATVNERSLRKRGLQVDGNSTPVCYLVGYMLGKLALSREVEEAVLDIGRRKLTRGGRITAVLKGAVDAGLYVPHDESILPSEDRIKGKHLKDSKRFSGIDEMKRALEVVQ
ncbi:hypothetical protein GCM10007108_07780 [Thermogymnomonas acidicola]|uniref:Large ribosomal subunit protein uL18 n=1 Tax=Thermogymnomonas acidicola TaxID=399579 RepID=A0AA37F9D7_9ARCH|nr:50S ribosomal protein L18 [Thermogymnomonas acidicola]GGM72077.1 hypothetical protein GCM10007108_07780 [Thermogymnomonas acidicola]